MQILAGVQYPDGRKSIQTNYSWTHPDPSREVVYSEKLPDFKRLIQEGSLLPYTEHHVRGSEWTKWTKSSDHRCTSYSTYTGDYLMTHFGPSVFTGLKTASAPTLQLRDVDQTIKRVQQRAHEAARKGAFMIAVELFEAPKVYRLFLDFVRLLKRRRAAVQAFLEDRLKKGDLITFAQAWLEYRYGWRQLYFSARSLHKGLSLLGHSSKKLMITEHALGVVPGDIVSWPNISLRNYCTYRGLYSSSYNEVTKKATVSTEVRAATSMVVSRLTKAIDMNPFSFAWEITPFSFIVDWFLTTGDFFAALWPSFPKGPSEETNCYSLKTCAKLQYKGDSLPPLTYTPRSGYRCEIEVGGSAYATYEFEEYHRVPVLSGDIPLTLQWNVNLDWKKISDLLAIVATMGKSRRSVRI